MSRFITLAVASTVLFAASATPLHACTCVPHSALCGAAGDFWRTTAVFIGRVESVERAAAKQAARPIGTRRVRLRVLEAFRGTTAPGSDVIVTTGSGGGDCGFPFAEGQEYLVYATRYEESGELSTGICSRTRPAAAAAADIEYARAAAAGRAPAGRITGEVRLETRDLSGSRRTQRSPLSGITVVLSKDGSVTRAVTDARGQYSVEGLTPGKYALGVELPETYYSMQSGQTVELSDTRACAAASVIVMHNGRVAGRVVDPAGRGMPGLSVELTVPLRIDEPFGAERIVALTKSDGTFELTGVPSGRFVVGINIRRPDAEQLFKPRLFYPGVEKLGDAGMVSVSGGGRVILDDLVLPPHLKYVRLEGIVLGPDGSPAPNADVFIKDDADSSYAGDSSVTDSSGRFLRAVLAGRSYRLFAERARRTERTSSTESSDPVTLIAAADSPPLRLTLRRRY
jgi:carboxypeptidase family protein